MRHSLTTILLLPLLLGCGSEPAAPNRTPTAGPGVVVLPDTLTIPGLDRRRTLRIYLPPDYEQGQDHYPVLYLHDGQNLFDDATAYAGEWGADETLDSLATRRGMAFIAVGVDNGGELRMNELGPYPNERFAPQEGAAYVDFIVNVVKPFVDTTYRTLPDRTNTAILGSSMGGLISHYALLEYPDVFSRAGIFSPSYWFSAETFSQVAVAPPPADARLYLLVGGREGEEMVTDTRRMRDSLLAAGLPEDRLRLIVDEAGEHNEAFWRRYFGEAVAWLFAEG